MGDPAYHSWGEEISPADLKLSYAQGLLSAVQGHPFARLQGLRRDGAREAVVFDLDPELPQRPEYELKRSERIALVLDPDPTKLPLSLALRTDFPDTPHQNLVPKGEPRSLCLFVEPWSELRHTVTPKRLLFRLSQWFERAGMGRLHLENQRLEPFVIATEKLIVSEDVFQTRAREGVIVYSPPHSEGQPILKALRVPDTVKDIPTTLRFFLLPLEGKPSNGSLISNLPRTFADLCEVLERAGINLVEKVRDATRSLFLDGGRFVRHADKRWIFLVRLPKYRNDSTKEDDVEFLAFAVIKATITELGEELGVLARAGKQIGTLLGGGAPPRKSEAAIGVLDPVVARSRRLAQEVTGISVEARKFGAGFRIAAIGAGALGSHAVLSIARQGIGEWDIIDDDYFLPHNTYRHALSADWEGAGKAKALAEEINLLLDDKKAARAIARNVLEHEASPGEMRDTLSNASHILDFSASRGVIHSLAAAEGNAPRFSAYIVGLGGALVCLWEGNERRIRLDDLDLQLARASAEDEALARLHVVPGGATVRYGGSCSSITSRLSPDLVALHASMASLHYRRVMDEPDSSIAVWTYDSRSGEYRSFRVSPSSVKVLAANGWSVRIEASLLEGIRRLRREALPSETGGVLLGAFDVFRKTIFVAKALPAPRDSEKSEAGFGRGVEGLKAECDRLRQKSGNVLEYVGEWHSHPRGYPAVPSLADLRAIAILAGEMTHEGLPSLFLIQGDAEDPGVILGQEWK